MFDIFVNYKSDSLSIFSLLKKFVMFQLLFLFYMPKIKNLPGTGKIAQYTSGHAGGRGSISRTSGPSEMTSKCQAGSGP